MVQRADPRTARASSEARLGKTGLRLSSPISQADAAVAHQVTSPGCTRCHPAASKSTAVGSSAVAPPKGREILGFPLGILKLIRGPGLLCVYGGIF